jgi:hypothetical protein
VFSKEEMMTVFLKTACGELVNAALIRSVFERDRVAYAYMQDDETEVRLEARLAQFQRALTPIVPSQPGYLALSYCPKDDDRSVLVIRAPVVAWSLDGEAPIPVVLADDLWAWDAVSCPSGQVAALGHVFDDEAAWLKFMAETAKKAA